MAYFGASTIESIVEGVKGLLETYQPDLEFSLNLSEDDKLPVNFKAMITVVNELDNDVEVTMTFTKEKIKDSIKDTATEKSETQVKEIDVPKKFKKK